MTSHSQRNQIDLNQACTDRPTKGSVLSPERRRELFRVHPLIKGNVALPTPPVQELYRALIRVVLLRDAGCCITAPSGFGKSSALRLIRLQFSKDFPDLPVYKHSAFNHRVESVRSFFKHFLETAQNSNTSGETYDLRSRLSHTLVDNSQHSDLGLVLLLVDEAQEMLISDYGFLKDVYNALAEEDVRLIVVLMGESPRFGTQITQLVSAGRADLVNRFTERKFSLRPLRAVNDMRAILREIDLATFPQRPALKWTEFFFPTAFQSGFRLENECERFTDALARIARPRNKDVGYPAKQVFSAIRALVTDNAAYDSHDMKLPKLAWDEAVKWAKMEDALHLANAAADLAVKI